MNSLSRTSEHLQPTGEDGYCPCVSSDGYHSYQTLHLLFYFLLSFKLKHDRKAQLIFFFFFGLGSGSFDLFKNLLIVINIQYLLLFKYIFIFELPPDRE